MIVSSTVHPPALPAPLAIKGWVGNRNGTARGMQLEEVLSQAPSSVRLFAFPPERALPLV